MSETMTASERARELVARNEGAAMTFWENQNLTDYETMKQARAALLAYVARLEACVAAARAVVDAELRTDLPYDEALDELRERLAALDRPEDGQ